MIDEVFTKAIAAKPKGIILDLRSCTGFDLTALRAACWLVEGRHDAGRFVAATHRQADGSGDARMDIDSSASVEAAHDLLKRSRVAAFGVVGEPGAYAGPLAVLTLERTRSSAEILAWLLRDRPDTRFFGNATAGRPRIDFVQPLEQGFVIRIPEFDWQSPGGELGVCKVVPDVRCAAKKAPAIAAEWLTSRAVAATP
jgi:C-terminal processing protease CtpA/Prc